MSTTTIISRIGYDPEDDLEQQIGRNNGNASGSRYIHIRMQKRSGRNYITLLQGLPEAQCPKALKAMRQQLCCNGTIIVSDQHGHVVQLQGDQRQRVKEFLLAKRVIDDPDRIVIHGI
jgi:translation initiation factor 1